MSKKIFIIVGDNLGLSRKQIDYDALEIVKFPVFVGETEYRQSCLFHPKSIPVFQSKSIPF